MKSPAGCRSSGHETAGVDCCGCIIAIVEGSNVELRCNELRSRYVCHTDRITLTRSDGMNGFRMNGKTSRPSVSV
jgi:hypothetical protein